MDDHLCAGARDRRAARERCTHRHDHRRLDTETASGSGEAMALRTGSLLRGSARGHTDGGDEKRHTG